jgi:hypothetical protein
LGVANGDVDCHGSVTVQSRNKNITGAGVVISPLLFLGLESTSLRKGSEKVLDSRVPLVKVVEFAAQ